jgi:hypothetical protein
VGFEIVDIDKPRLGLFLEPCPEAGEVIKGLLAESEKAKT